MRVSIIAADNLIYIDGEAHDCDCSGLLASGVSAVQWHDGQGEVEFVGHVEPNEMITNFEPFQAFVDKAKARGLPFFDNTKFALSHAIQKREADPQTRLGHFKDADWPVVLGPDGMPARKPL